MACTCIETVNQKLASRNTRLVSTIVFTQPGGEYPLIRTEPAESGRGKAKACAMLPTFCPFCGVRYREED